MAVIGGILAGQAIADAGVNCVFTLCGGHIAPIYIGLQLNGVRIIDVRHEAAAAHAADAWGRLTGVPGVAIVTAGPGVTNALTGIANAFEAESPMVVIGGRVGMARQDQGSLQEMDHLSLVSSITKWRACVYETARIPEYLHRAFHIAGTGRRGPVYLEIPIDLLLSQAEPRREGPSPQDFEQALTQPNQASLEAALDLIVRAKRPVAVGGSSLHWDDAGGSLDAFARRLNLPVYLNGMGRGALPWNHPHFFKFTRKKALSSADVIILIGVPADFRLNYGRDFHPDAKIVVIEPDAVNVGFNIRPARVLTGNSRLVLGDLTRLASERPASDSKKEWIDALRSAEDEAHRAVEDELASEISPVNPYRFSAEIAKAVDENTIVIGDGGNIVATASKIVRLSGLRQWMDPGKFGCLGVGLPFALAAQAAFPDKKVLVIQGDGSVGFNGFEMDTAVRHNLPIVAVVGNDAAWTEIRASQIEAAGEEFAVATKLAPTRYELFAKGLGADGYHVESPGEIAETIRRAFANRRPAVINVPLDAALNGRGVSYIAAGMA